MNDFTVFEKTKILNNLPLVCLPYKKEILATIKPCINITAEPKPLEALALWESKFGGTPYLPLAADYPKTFDGEPLYLLAQINFEEVPSLPPFPKKGILQFWITSGENTYHGLHYDGHGTDHIGQNFFRVIYYPEVAKEGLVEDLSFFPVPPPETLPFEDLSACYKLDFSLVAMPVHPNDEIFFPPLLKSVHEEKSWDFEVAYIDDFYYELYPDKHLIGGYPSFYQGDSRIREHKDKTVCLFQMISQNTEEYPIMWGDVGIAQFFISPEDLQRRDFSHVLFDWQCG